MKETSFSYDNRSNYPGSSDTEVNSNAIHYLGAWNNGGLQYFDGYLADVNFLDGITVGDTSGVLDEFIEIKNGVCIPKRYTGSYGTNGYRLEFTGFLGTDTSDEGNNWTPNGFDSDDTNIPDCPENNFCTLNFIGRRYGMANAGTFSEGNLKYVTAGNASGAWGGMAINQIASEGGVYFEIRFDVIDSPRCYFGLIGDSGVNNKNSNNNGASYSFPVKATITQSLYLDILGSETTNRVDLTPSTISGNTAFSAGDVAGFAILSDGKLFIHRNGTYLKNASGNTGNPSTGANPVTTIDLTEGDWFPHVGYNSSFTVNFGQDGTFNGNETPADTYTDANSIGKFNYAVPTNCLAICTSNMAEPTIGPSSSTQAEDHHGTLTYTSDGNAVNIVSGGNDNNGTAVGGEINFSPDWVWIKRKDASNNHQIFDTNRGTNVLVPNENGAESDYSSYFAFLSSSNGFRLPASSANMNANGGTYVAWLWRANGGTTTTNDASATGIGSIDSVHQANTTAGFSIVTYTGDSSGNNGTASTVAHGLGAVPKWIWFIPRDAYDGCVYHEQVATDPATDKLILAASSSSDAQSAASDDSGFFNDTEPTSTVFSIGTRKHSNSNGGMVAYCFAEVDGYSKFGSYHGNGGTDGTFVYTGFRPAWLMYKRSDTTGNWLIDDNVTQAFNPDSNYWVAETADLQGDTTTNTAGHVFDMYSNGFKMRNTNSARNASGGLYVYMAFADIPFKFANAR